MRTVAFLLVAVAGLLGSPAAFAAAECAGEMCRGTGVSAFSNEDLNIFLAIAIFIGFLALVALLPDFDGRTDEDWDMQGRDDLWRH